MCGLNPIYRIYLFIYTDGCIYSIIDSVINTSKNKYLGLDYIILQNTVLTQLDWENRENSK